MPCCNVWGEGGKKGKKRGKGKKKGGGGAVADVKQMERIIDNEQQKHAQTRNLEKNAGHSDQLHATRLKVRRQAVGVEITV
jgi:hypothetical protein